jgi:hypothetical protein
MEPAGGTNLQQVLDSGPGAGQTPLPVTASGGTSGCAVLAWVGAAVVLALLVGGAALFMFRGTVLRLIANMNGGSAPGAAAPAAGPGTAPPPAATPGEAPAAPPATGAAPGTDGTAPAPAAPPADQGSDAIWISQINVSGGSYSYHELKLAPGETATLTLIISGNTTGITYDWQADVPIKPAEATCSVGPLQDGASGDIHVKVANGKDDDLEIIHVYCAGPPPGAAPPATPPSEPPATPPQTPPATPPANPPSNPPDSPAPGTPPANPPDNPPDNPPANPPASPPGN